MTTTLFLKNSEIMRICKYVNDIFKQVNKIIKEVQSKQTEKKPNQMLN